MTEEENVWLALLGGAGALLLAFLGMNAPKPATSSVGQIAPPKAKTGCGCSAGK